MGGVPISGLTDFEPIRRFSFNTDFKLDATYIITRWDIIKALS